MTEQLKSDNFSTPQNLESDILVLIKKMQQQLVFLEKKIDTLISQSQEKPFREKQFSKPFRSPDRSYRPGPGHHQDKRGQGEENRGYGGPKKNYSDDRDNSSGQERYFKKYDSKKRGFDPRKKPFFHKRKDQ